MYGHLNYLASCLLFLIKIKLKRVSYKTVLCFFLTTEILFYPLREHLNVHNSGFFTNSISMLFVMKGFP